MKTTYQCKKCKNVHTEIQHPGCEYERDLELCDKCRVSEMDEDIFLRDLLSSTTSPVVDNAPTEITLEDLEKALEIAMREPRKCSCGNGFPVQYQVSSPGCLYDDMCIQCFQELTKDGKVVWVGG